MLGQYFHCRTFKQNHLITTEYTLKKMLGCLNPNLGKIWTNHPNVGFRMQVKNVQLKVKIELG